MRHLWLVGPASVLFLTSCSEFKVRIADPRLALSEEEYRWDGIVAGTTEVRTITVANRGLAALVIDPVPNEAHIAFDPFPYETLVLEPAEERTLPVAFSPELPERYTGQIDLVTNDPDRPTVTLPLEGTAIEPRIRVEPDTVAFGWVRPNGLVSRTIRIEARGSGRLEIVDFVFEDPVVERAFGLGLPQSVPIELDAGQDLSLAVLFRPPDRQRYDGRLEVISNAVNPSDGLVRLLGNSDTDPQVNAAPQVEILAPKDGLLVLPGQALQVVAAVFDEEDDPVALTTQLGVDGVVQGSVGPDAEGLVQFEAMAALLGSTELEVTVVDSEGAMGSDTVTVDVLDPDERLNYVLSGGIDPTTPFTVDDDLRIEVDGVMVFEDRNTIIDTHAPVTFEASPSSEIRIVATDQQFCEASMDGLVLHSALGGTQALNAPICRSACPDTPCYDPNYDGPWPSDFLDETYAISIP
ncbi:MAG: choice-of-anchor D domain-containing protein [Myxococcota bacterium]